MKEEEVYKEVEVVFEGGKNKTPPKKKNLRRIIDDTDGDVISKELFEFAKRKHENSNSNRLE